MAELVPPTEAPSAAGRSIEANDAMHPYDERGTGPPLALIHDGVA